MRAIEKQANAIARKSMTKKAWKHYVSNDRAEAMPRPAVFKDKRYSNKYRAIAYD